MEKGKKLEQVYDKLSQLEHVLKRPNVYIGSITTEDYETYVWDNKSNRIVKKTIGFNAGLDRIFEEIILNAADQVIRAREDTSRTPVKRIDVNFDKVKHMITIRNDGDGIPVQKHSVHKQYIPEMLFSELNSSSNYDDTGERLVSGVNGMGAKLTVIFSKFFEIETIGNDENGKSKKFTMTLKNNMSEKKVEKIVSSTKKQYTEVKFIPDLERFKMKDISQDMYDYMKKRVYDVAACLYDKNGVNPSIYLDDNKIDTKTFKDYISLYFEGDTKKIFYEQLNNRFHVGILLNTDEKFESVAFTNGIYNNMGGTHVNYVSNKIVKAVSDELKKKKIEAKSSFIKNKLNIFINSFIDRPTFSSQTKENLTNPSSEFSKYVEFSDSFINNFVKKSGILEEVISLVKFQEQRDNKKTDGGKKKTIKEDKLDDANWAGSNKSTQCRLILTEGDSAKAFASWGYSIIGRDRYGIFPLKGKMMNVKSYTDSKVYANKEIIALKKILGLETGKKYTSLESLRYGSIVILTDQDVDGYHIKGLVMNLFHTYWPELLELGFVKAMSTPIVKARKGDKEVIEFFTQTDFHNWKKKNDIGKGWVIKYYKGLGTSNNKEARDAFVGFEEKLINYTYDNLSNDAMNLAFDKSLSDKRKEWLMNFDPQNIVDSKDKEVSIPMFINNELIHFSYDDVFRSIPSVVDGFKPTQRKVMYGLFKMGSKTEVKVGQLSGYVSQHTDYHHGESSISGTIINMANTFVGSNNCNLLHPQGQFGTRNRGIDDAASERYTFTFANKISKMIFNQYDEKLLDFNLSEDGKITIEPKWYVPALPMILVNGSRGIGTGFSTTVLSHDTSEIIQAVKHKMKTGKVPKLKPSFRFHSGKVEEGEDGDRSYISWGNIEFDDKTESVIINELPIGVWTDNYKSKLEDWLIIKGQGKAKGEGKETQFIEEIENKSTPIDVYFKIKLKTALYKKFKNNDKKKVMKELKLSVTLSERNMYLFDEHEQIKLFATAEDILEYWYKIREVYYLKRKNLMIEELESELVELSNKVRFIKLINEEKIRITKVTEEEIEEQLKKLKFDKMNDKYDYLINMSIRILTIKHMNKLENDLKSMEKELATLQATSHTTMWSKELDEIMTENDNYNDKIIEDLEDLIKTGEKEKEGKEKKGKKKGN